MGGDQTFVLSGIRTLVYQTAEGQTAGRRLLAHSMFCHSTTGRICKLLLFLQLKIEGDTIKTKLGVSAISLPASLTACLPA